METILSDLKQLHNDADRIDTTGELSSRLETIILAECIAKQNAPVTELKKIVSQDSIVLKKNAKGDYQWEIKCYHEDTKTALDRTIAVDVRFRKEYGGNNNAI